MSRSTERRSLIRVRAMAQALGVARRSGATGTPGQVVPKRASRSWCDHVQKNAKSSDLETALPGLNPNQRTYQIRKLLESRMLQPIRPGARQYTIDFMGSMLLRGIIRALTDEGFIPSALLSAPRPDAT